MINHGVRGRFFGLRRHWRTMGMDMQELWLKTCELLRADISPISYNTWIGSNLTPVKMVGNLLVLRITMEKMRVMVTQRYVPVICDCASQVAGHRINVSVLTEAEIQAESNKAETANEGVVQLNPRYTFDTFVVGSNNRFAHAAALAVAEQPAEAYNPLFIHGGVGLGKTHLMHAIGHYIQEQYPEKRLLYITGENFTNDLVTAIAQNRNLEFRNRFRNVDVLMVDDIQFIAGRVSTQEEFFHTFNALHTSGKQIVLTSDKPPQDISTLEERLRSRFAWGLIADISKPDVETRMAILTKKANREHLSMPQSVIDMIASSVDSNIRELEGCFNRLVAYAKLVNQPITLELAQTALKDVLEKKQHRVITADVIMQTVCEYYSLKKEDLISASRRREITVPRQIAIYLTREMTELSLPQIGDCFGNRDHSTVLHSWKLVGDNMKNSADLTRQINDIRQMVIDG